MKMMKKLLCSLLTVVLVAFCLTACKKDAIESVASGSSTEVSSNVASISGQRINTNNDKVGFQLEAPVSGEEVAVLHTNYGDIYIRLFPELAPKAVENFKGLINKGYYNNLIFHRVIKDFMIQGGDPLGTGTGGESIWGDDFEDEFSDKLCNISYSLSMANSGVNTNGSQFFINNAPSASFSRDAYDYDTMMGRYNTTYQQYAQYYGAQFTSQYPDVEAFVQGNGGLAPDSRLVPDAVWELYKKHGGNIHLDGAWRATGGHTVFGQVYKGTDVVDRIADVETDSSNNKPIKDVVIQSAEIVKAK